MTGVGIDDLQSGISQSLSLTRELDYSGILGPQMLLNNVDDKYNDISGPK